MVPAQERGAPFGEPGNVSQNGKVLLDDLSHLGALHLHDNRSTVVQRGGMDLPDGRRCDRVPLERDEVIVDPSAQLLLHDRDDRVRIGRHHVILQLLQLFDVDRWQDIDARREDLAKLDERRSQFLERATEVRRPDPGRSGDILTSLPLRAASASGVEGRDESSEPMREQYPHDVLVATTVAAVQDNRLDHEDPCRFPTLYRSGPIRSAVPVYFRTGRRRACLRRARR